MEDLESVKLVYDSLALDTVPATVDPAMLLASLPQASTKLEAMRIDDPLPTRTGYIFDVEMKAHRPVTEVDEGHPEGPERITGIYDILRKNGLLARMRRLDIRRVTFEEACLVHSVDHWNNVQSIAGSYSKVVYGGSHCKSQKTLVRKAIQRIKSQSLSIDIQRIRSTSPLARRNVPN